ncbi:hypothetical protein PsYK624_041520 [Phanerochaete sordida]|uniref:Uncharacterized protein n=1 Tax=Phanerochaete sordida TaxID=48140 RepID=A0A9P3G5W0_9APHY|nr:hypothetical protein PsYK624_041520 [Phanerochaete sordida]
MPSGLKLTVKNASTPSDLCQFRTMRLGPPSLPTRDLPGQLLIVRALMSMGPDIMRSSASTLCDLPVFRPCNILTRRARVVSFISTILGTSCVF